MAFTFDTRFLAYFDLICDIVLAKNFTLDDFGLRGFGYVRGARGEYCIAVVCTAILREESDKALVIPREHMDWKQIVIGYLQRMKPSDWILPNCSLHCLNKDLETSNVKV
jgi:hypothetical protein